MAESAGGWYEAVGPADGLRQGDLVPRCWVPRLDDPWPPEAGAAGTVEYSVQAERHHVIVLTQSCDLANQPLPGTALVGLLADLTTLSEDQPAFASTAVRNELRLGRRLGLYLLDQQAISAELPQDWLVVDFGDLVSVPLGWLQHAVQSAGRRPRLRVPLRERLAQALGLYYMRVAIDDHLAVPPFANASQPAPRQLLELAADELDQRVLERFAERGRPLTPRQLSSRLAVSPGEVVRSLQRLAAQGLLCAPENYGGLLTSESIGIVGGRRNHGPEVVAPDGAQLAGAVFDGHACAWDNRPFSRLTAP
ncbi:MAG: GntR family transcriptional regulator [Fimbriimonadaceae bacterium]|nr:GntR family transcriptional regulator [Fimbriimonadaceae bacterium]